MTKEIKSNNSNFLKKEFAISRLLVPTIIFTACLVFFGSEASRIDDGVNLTIDEAAKLWKIAFQKVIATTLILSIIYFLTIGKQTPEKIAIKKEKEKTQIKEKELQEQLRKRFSELPKHLKALKAIACDNENRQLLVHKGGFTTKYHCIDYSDVVSFHESYADYVTTRTALIGTKTNVTEVDNEIILTVRGEIGPTIKIPLNRPEEREKCLALLTANLC